METNFNLGSLKIVYTPLMEYFKKIQTNIADNLVLVRDENKVATNYEFIDVLGKTQASLKMMGLTGIVKIIALIKEASKDLKNVKFDTPTSIKVWETNQELLSNIENYLKQLLDGELDQPTKMFSQYKSLADLVGFPVTIKDLFSPKLDINTSDDNLQKELRVGQFINDSNKNVLVENIKKSHTIIQQSLIILLAGIAQNGIFNSNEEKNTHHGACKKIYEVLNQLQSQKISKSYYVMFGIQKLLVCTATPVFNDSFSGLVGEYSKELNFNLPKIEKGLKILIDEINDLENGDKTGSLKADEDIIKENLFFVIEILNSNKKLKDMPVFKELTDYFDYSFYENQLKDTTFKVSFSQSHPEESNQIDKNLTEIKEQLNLLTTKSNSETALNQNVNKFFNLIAHFNNLVKTDEILKDFSTNILNSLEKLKNKEISFTDDFQKEVSMAVLLLEYAINILIKKTPSNNTKEEFRQQLLLQSQRLKYASEEKDLSSLALPVLDFKNKENDEQQALLKIFEEISKDLKQVEEVLDALLRGNSLDYADITTVFKPLNNIKGILGVTGNKELANIIKEITVALKTLEEKGLEGVEKDLLKNSIVWLSGLSLFIAASENNNALEAQEIEEKLIKSFNEYKGFAKDVTVEQIIFENESINKVEEPKEKEFVAEELINELIPEETVELVIDETIQKISEFQEKANDPELLEIFLEEVITVQENLNNNFSLLKDDLHNQDALLNIRRGFHTLKGSGKMVGLHNLGELAWIVEQELNRVMSNNETVTIELVKACEYMAYRFEDWMLELKSSPVITVNKNIVEESFNTILNSNKKENIVPEIENEININDIIQSTPIIEEKEVVLINGLEIEKTIYDMFEKESTENVEKLSNIINDKNIQKLSSDFIRYAHTLSSISQSVNLSHFANISTKLEEISELILNNARILTEHDINVLAYAVNNLNSFKNQSINQQNYDQMILDLENLNQKIIHEESENLEKLDYFEEDKEESLEEIMDVVEAETIKTTENNSSEEISELAKQFKLTIENTVSELKETILTLQNQVKEIKENSIHSNNEEILSKVENLIDNKHKILLEQLVNHEKIKNQETKDLLEKINELTESVKTIKDEQSSIQETQTKGVESIRKDLRSLAHIVKKKSSESYQNIFGDEVTQESESNINIEFDNDSQNLEYFNINDSDNLEDSLVELFNNNSYIQAIFEEKISTVIDEFDHEIYEISKEEVSDMFSKIENVLENVKFDNINIEENNTLKRYLHTLKGSLRMAGANKMGAIAHRLESVLDYSENHTLSLFKIKPLIQKEIIKLHYLEDNNGSILTKNKEIWLDSVIENQNKNDLEEELIEVLPKVELAPLKKDDKQYIRVVSNVLDSLINEAGEIRLARTTLEGTLDNNKKSLVDLKTSSKKLGKILKEIEMQAEVQISARKDELIETGKDFDPLELDRFTRLQELTRFMNETVLDVKDSIDYLDNLYRTQESAVIQQSIVTNNMLDSLMKIRLISVDTINDRLYKVTRNTSKEMGKHVILELYGEKTEMDRLVLESIQSPLEHLVRNCIAHGIESPEIRELNKKPAIGKIKIDVNQDGNFIIIKISDDGAGINLEKVKKIGYDKGFLEENKEYSNDEIIDLIFKSGFSTAEVVSQVSGRGVGMDIVKNEVFSLGGSIKTETKQGEGTQFTIVLPVAVATNQAMLTEINGKLVAIPAILVDQVVSMKKGKLEIAYEEGKITYNNIDYPIYYLGHLMGLLSPLQSPEIKFYNTLILISYLDQKIVVHVDKLETTDEILIKQLGPYFGKISGLVGATLLGDGRQGIVVNPVLLKDHFNKNIKKEKHENNIAVPVEEVTKKNEVITVMVVDDSITVRRATSKILEKYGYNVILAKDGEQGLEQLQISIPDIILSDIEMPNMDGFEFVKNVKNIEKYKKIPIVMITSRTADKHRKLAYTLGVDSFLGKPYQEDELIKQIIQLTKS